jgi:hypothetical protein
VRNSETDSSNRHGYLDELRQGADLPEEGIRNAATLFRP